MDDFDIHHIRHRLKELGATQGMLAEFLQVDTSAVSRALAGKRVFSHSERTKTAEFISMLEEEVAAGIPQWQQVNINRIENFRLLLAERGLGVESLAERTGLGMLEIAEYLSGTGRPMLDEVAHELSEVLGRDLDSPASKPSTRRRRTPSRTGESSSKGAPGDIPIYMAPAPAADLLFTCAFVLAERRTAPAAQDRVPGTYGIFCPDYGLEPKFAAGEVLFVHPGRSVGVGTYALAVLQDTRVGIGRVLVNDAEHLVLESGTGRVELTRARVRKVQRIVGVWFD